MADRRCRACGITHIEPGIEIDGEPLCWAADDLCSSCQDLQQKALEADAARYRYLRDSTARVVDIVAGGKWRVAPDQQILRGGGLDRAIDAELGIAPVGEPLEARLAACLAACIDEPLLVGAAEIGDIVNPKPEIYLRFFRPDLSERAAELLEEAGR